eukprot:8944120-Ditylum_brightwellii.AAC.1
MQQNRNPFWENYSGRVCQKRQMRKCPAGSTNQMKFSPHLSPKSRCSKMRVPAYTPNQQIVLAQHNYPKNVERILARMKEVTKDTIIKKDFGKDAPQDPQAFATLPKANRNTSLLEKPLLNYDVMISVDEAAKDGIIYIMPIDSTACPVEEPCLW